MKQKTWSAFWADLFNKPVKSANMEDIVIETLGELNYKFMQVANEEDYKAFQLTLGVKNGRLESLTEIFKELSLVRILTVLGIAVEESKRLDVAELIARINRNNNLGFFEFNLDNGELRYNCSFAYNGLINLPSEIYLRNFEASFNTMDFYLPGILAVIYGDLSPQAAINQVMNQVDPQLN